MRASRASAANVDQVLALYARWGADRYDEELSQLDHALQTAALATADSAPDELVAAALLHDVGHLLDLEAAADAGRTGPAGADLHHEAVGARHLAGLFPPTVTNPIALHVRAKRYRCAVDPAYHDTLSAGSTASLARQGGPLDPDEARAFEQLPGHAEAVTLRGWDDGGKVDGLDVPSLDAYRELLVRVARNAG